MQYNIAAISCNSRLVGYPAERIGAYSTLHRDIVTYDSLNCFFSGFDDDIVSVTRHNNDVPHNCRPSRALWV